MKRICYNSAYIPPEWIEAHGFQPFRPCNHKPFNENRAPISVDGCCTWSQVYITQATMHENVAAVIVASICDQLRRSSEALNTPGRHHTPTMLLHIPATWQSESAQRCYRDELHRLGNFLESIGGTSPTPGRLKSILIAYEVKREDVRMQLQTMTGRERATALAAMHGDTNGKPEHAHRAPRVPHFDCAAAKCAHEDTLCPSGQSVAPRATESRDSSATPIALLGSELPRYQWWLFDTIKQHGGHVALDATDYGQRGLPEPIDQSLIDNDPFEAMASAYQQIPHIRQRPNDRFFDWLLNAIKQTNVKGIILRRSLWCDLWHAEVHRIKQLSPIPVIDIDLDVDATTCERAEGRIAAFLEMLR